jgi:hypothetical protein
LHSLRDFLLRHRIDEVQDWTSMYTTDVSADGRTFVGYGINPRVETEAWIATIPEPSSVALCLMWAFVAVATYRLRRAR